MDKTPLDELLKIHLTLCVVKLIRVVMRELLKFKSELPLKLPLNLNNSKVHSVERRVFIEQLIYKPPDYQSHDGKIGRFWGGGPVVLSSFVFE